MRKLLSDDVEVIEKISHLSKETLNYADNNYTMELSNMISSMHSAIATDFDESMMNAISDLTKKYELTVSIFNQLRNKYKYFKISEYSDLDVKDVDLATLKRYVQEDICQEAWENKKKISDSVFDMIAIANRKIIARSGLVLPSDFDNNYSDVTAIATAYYQKPVATTGTRRLTKIVSGISIYLTSVSKFIDYMNTEKESIYTNMNRVKLSMCSRLSLNKTRVESSVTSNCGSTIDCMEFMIFMYSYAKDLFTFYATIVGIDLTGINEYMTNMLSENVK